MKCLFQENKFFSFPQAILKAPLQKSGLNRSGLVEFIPLLIGLRDPQGRSPTNHTY